MKKLFNLGESTILPITLTQEQECMYIKIYKHSINIIEKNNALEMLVRSKYKLVLSIARQFAKDTNDFNDLVEEGLIGLQTGINKFDETKNIKLTTYVYLWIVQTIQRNMGKNSLIYVPEEVRKLASQVNLIKEQFKQEHGGLEPSLEYIAQQLDTTYSKIYNATTSTKYAFSFDNIITSDNDNSFESIIKDNTLTTNDKLIQQEKHNELIEILCKLLNKNEMFVIEHYFGINDCEKNSLKDIAKILCLSEARIKQIKAQAILKMSQSEKLKKLEY